jgi:AcrR family transcriptional regulator
MVRNSVKRRAPLTERGEETHEKLLRSAEKAFSQHGYHRASVAHICRLSKVANGTFYQYFSDKEEIFVALVTHLAEKLHAALSSDVNNTESALTQLETLIKAYLQFLQTHRRLYQVFREAEFIRLDLSQDFYRYLTERFRAIILKGMDAKEFRPCDPEVIAYCLIGLQEFLALRYVIWEDALNEKVFQASYQLIAHGISLNGEKNKNLLKTKKFSLRAPLQSASLIAGNETRDRLLQAAEQEFGKNGFHHTSVADIARRAEVALGTVYLYFKSKSEIFVELIHEINHGLRRASAGAVGGLTDRRTIEEAGFHAFFDFINHHRQAYSIVREAEFVQGQLGRWYYLTLGKPYAEGLHKAMKRGEIIMAPAEPLAYQLMGVGHFLGLRWLIWPSFATTDQSELPMLPKAVFEETMRFILYGLLI